MRAVDLPNFSWSPCSLQNFDNRLEPIDVLERAKPRRVVHEDTEKSVYDGGRECRARCTEITGGKEEV